MSGIKQTADLKHCLSQSVSTDTVGLTPNLIIYISLLFKNNF